MLVIYIAILISKNMNLINTMNKAISNAHTLSFIKYSFTNFRFPTVKQLVRGERDMSST